MPDRQRPLCRVSFIGREPRGHSAKKNDRHGAGPVDGGFTAADTRQRFLFFLKKILCRVSTGQRSAKFEFFLKKNSLLSALWRALGKV